MPPQLGCSPQQEKQSSRLSSENIPVTPGHSASTGAVISNKARIRWTQDLHEKFVECVIRLGGAESKSFDISFIKIRNKPSVSYDFSMINYRGNAKGNTKADELGWIDHFSCEKSSSGIKAF